jgi:hypothetical protein
MHFSTRHQIMMTSGQFHVPAALLPVPVLYDATWALVRSRRNGGETVSGLAKIVTLFYLDYSHPLCLLRCPGFTYREPVFMV